MNTEDKQKAMLADDLSVYIKDKHTQEECIGFIDGYNAALTKLKLLGIGDVVGQSEQCAHTSTDIRTLRCNCCNDCGEILDVLD